MLPFARSKHLQFTSDSSNNLSTFLTVFFVETEGHLNTFKVTCGNAIIPSSDDGLSHYRKVVVFV